jgi:hypothetical protein
MKVYFIDEIVRSALLTCGKPLHYYMEFLHYGLKGLKEINYDSPIRVRSTRATVNDFNEITLPNDYVDFIKVGYENGQHVVPLVRKDSFNRMMRLDSDGNQIAYAPVEIDTDQMYADSYYYSSHGNDKGEHIGKHFGHRASYNGAFMVIPERNVIMVDPSVKVKTIVIDYISTGIGLENNGRTTLPAYAAEAVERYILWRYMEHSQIVPMNQKQLAKEEWIHSFKRYRSREYQLSINDVLRSLRSHTFAAIKS